MTTITASSYSPNSPAQPLNPLRPGQVALLNRGAANDVSQRVRTVVQRHLGYQGTEEYRAHFTKQQITFTLRNGNAAENRTLVLQNSHWMLSQNNAPATPLDEALENEVNTLVTEILTRIGQASTTNAPDPAVPAAAVDGAEQPAAVANNAELADVRARLAALEGQLRTNPTLEQSLRIQQEILREVARLREALERHPQANTAGRDELQSRVAELQRTLDERERAFQRHISEGKAEFERLQTGLASDRQQLLRQQQAAIEAKDQAALALQQRVSDLEAAVAQKGTEQKRASEAFEAFKAEKESIQKQLQAQCARDVQAAGEKVDRYERAARDAAQLTNRSITALSEQQAQKTALEQQLTTVRSELAQLKQTNQRGLAEASSQLEALRTEKAALEASLGTSTDEAKVANAQLSQRVAELGKQIQAQQAQLESDERLNQSQAALIATQKQQLEELEELLRSTNEEDRSKVAALEDQNRQLEAAQSKNASELAAATSALQSLKTKHAQQLQEKNEAIQLLQAELSGVKKLLEGYTQALQEQSALSTREMDARSKQNQALLHNLQLLETKHADQVRSLESTLAEKERALANEQQNAKYLEADFKEKLASQVKAVEALQTEKVGLQTRFDQERQNLLREKDEALQIGKTAEARIKALEEELRTIEQRLQEMLRTKQEAVAAAMRANQAASRDLVATEHEVAALMASVQPGVRIAAATATSAYKEEGRNTAAGNLEIAARTASVPTSLRIVTYAQSLLDGKQ